MTESAPNVELKWVEGLQFVGQANGSGHALIIDGDPNSGGLDTGIRPMEAMLLSLASCSAMDIVSIMKKKQQDLRSFRVEVRGTRADEHPRRWTHIELTYVFTGKDISPQAAARSIELSETKYCGAIASVNAEIVTSFRIEEPA